ncbi:MAG: cytochrome c [Sulfobacillus sp.]|nr:cytochrome c [Sulfobacillus sp.]
MKQWWIWLGGFAVLAGGCGSATAKESSRPHISFHTPRSGPKEDRQTAQNEALSAHPNRSKFKKVASVNHPLPATRLTAGQQLFQQKCQSCHGPGGVGSNNAPRLAAPSHLVLTYHSPEKLADYIDRHMPADHPGSLTKAQARLLADYLWHLAQAR